MIATIRRNLLAMATIIDLKLPDALLPLHMKIHSNLDFVGIQI